MQTPADLATGETVFAARERAELLREAMLETLDDLELRIVIARLSGVTIRDARIYTGTRRTNSVLDIEKRALAKLGAWFEARGVMTIADIF